MISDRSRPIEASHSRMGYGVRVAHEYEEFNLASHTASEEQSHRGPRGSSARLHGQGAAWIHIVLRFREQDQSFLRAADLRGASARRRLHHRHRCRFRQDPLRHGARGVFIQPVLPRAIHPRLGLADPPAHHAPLWNAVDRQAGNPDARICPGAARHLGRVRVGSAARFPGRDVSTYAPRPSSPRISAASAARACYSGPSGRA